MILFIPLLLSAVISVWLHYNKGFSYTLCCIIFSLCCLVIYIVYVVTDYGITKDKNDNHRVIKSAL